MNEVDVKQLMKQNEIIISLLGRLAFPANEIREMVTKGKKHPSKYLDGYNACDGKHTLTEIAKIVGVSSGTLSPIIRDWEEVGIVYEVHRPGGKFYKRLYPI